MSELKEFRENLEYCLHDDTIFASATINIDHKIKNSSVSFEPERKKIERKFDDLILQLAEEIKKERRPFGVTDESWMT